jgi:hypothetical protein
MIASREIQVTVDGIFYKVNAGEAIPPPLAAYWKAANLEDKIRSAGMVEAEPATKAAPAERPAAASAKKETA